MIDYLLSFASEAAARSDAVVGAYFVNGAWRGDVTIPNVSGSGASGWVITIASPVPIPALASHPNGVVTADWDAEATLKGSPTTMAAVSPVFFGRDPYLEDESGNAIGDESGIEIVAL